MISGPPNVNGRESNPLSNKTFRSLTLKMSEADYQAYLSLQGKSREKFEQSLKFTLTWLETGVDLPIAVEKQKTHKTARIKLKLNRLSCLTFSSQLAHIEKQSIQAGEHPV